MLHGDVIVNTASTYSLIGLCGFAVLATLDQALGLGGGALLADICRTILEGDAGGEGMGGMAMEIKPVPIIGLSLAFTGAAIFLMTRDQRRIADGRSEPDAQESAAILSAMFLMARAHGKIARDEVRDVYKIVTGHDLEPRLLDHFLSRFGDALQDQTTMRLDPVQTSIGRRRALAAAFMVGCVGRPPSPAITELIEQLSDDIGASADDIRAAKAALNEWQDGVEPLQGVSPVALLRNRALTLRPA